MKDSDLLQYAKQLRKEMTPQERKLWYLFLKKYPVKFYKQKVIGPYIVDFYCAPAKIVIEIDGSQHYMPEGIAYDDVRSAALNNRGLEVLRFSNREIDREFEQVCEYIHRIVSTRMTPLSQPAADSSPL